jgi:hypothetical protein
MYMPIIVFPYATYSITQIVQKVLLMYKQDVCTTTKLSLK